MTKNQAELMSLYSCEELYAGIHLRCVALEKLIARVENELKRFPQDLPDKTVCAFYVRKDHKKRQYYLRSDGEKCGTYLRKTDANEKMVKLLIQREYDEKMLDAAKREYNFLRQGRKFAGNRICSIPDKMGKAKQEWVKPYLLSDDDYVEKWKEKWNAPPKHKPESLVFETKQGEYVRSKSELLIANMLFDKDIPYCYETPLKDNNGIWALPDFTVLNKRTKSMYYWEHFGMMGDADYAEKAVQKIHSYEKHHMLQGREIIMTFETKTQPLTVKNIENLINKFLT